MEPSKVVVWGIREDFDEIYNSLKYEENKNNIQIVCLCCRKDDIESPTQDGYAVVCKDDLISKEFDYIVIANKGAYKAIEKEAIDIIHRKNASNKIVILSSDIFKIPRFDFDLCINQNNCLKKILLQHDIIKDFDILDVNKGFLNKFHPFEEEFIESYSNTPDKSALLEKFKAGLDDFNYQEIVSIIKRMEIYYQASIKINDGYNPVRYYYLQPYSKDDFKKLKSIQDSVESQVEYNSGDKFWSYKNFKQTRKDFDLTCYYYKYYADEISNKSIVDNKSIIDAGAYIGDSALILQKEYKCKNVIAFDPSPNTFNELKRTVALNNINNIICENKGLGDLNGQLEFYLSTDKVGSSFDNKDKHLIKKEENTLSVDVVTLDSYVEKNKIKVGLIKTDLEGFEQPFLRGAKNTIIKDRPILIISIYHSFDDFFNIKEWLISLNCNYKFKVVKKLNGCLIVETVLIAEPII